MELVPGRFRAEVEPEFHSLAHEVGEGLGTAVELAAPRDDALVLAVPVFEYDGTM